VLTIKGDGLDPARERFQCGAELIGADNVAAASEIVALAIEALAAAGGRNISVDFTLPDLVDTLAEKAMPLAPGQIEAVRRELDTKDAGGLIDAGGEAYVPLLYATGDFDAAIEKLAAIDAGGVLAGRIAALRQIAARLAGRRGSRSIRPNGTASNTRPGSASRSMPKACAACWGGAAPTASPVPTG
jgi:ATP phosphoribosyltransferase regulatory subunit